MISKFKMETMLKVKDLLGFVNRKETKPKATIVVALVVYKKKENDALNLIGQSLSNIQLLLMQRSPL